MDFKVVETCRLYCAVMVLCLFSWAASPFDVNATLTATGQGTWNLSLAFKIPPEHHLYESELKVEAEGLEIEQVAGDKAVELEGDMVFTHDFRREYRLKGDAQEPLTVWVTMMGCSDKGLCYPPDKRELKLTTSGATVTDVKKTAVEASPFEKETLSSFKTGGVAEGYMRSKAFLEWLENSLSGNNEQDNGGNLLQRVLSKYGLWLVALLLLPLGAMLNLTPCVLPMIPINLAILGAGAKDGRKGHGFGLGLGYALGMALSYGLLGVIVVLTGSRFGAINSSAWFNFAVALVFVFLGLAMFDVFAIDFSRYRGQGGMQRRGTMVGAFLLGGLTAVLAGACVAPVLIWVLVMATEMYADGKTVGLILPFLLGAGMGLPWPFLGAGLSMLPKPGAWMEKVKKLFGVLIFAMALYYAHVGWNLLNWKDKGNSDNDGWRTDVAQALEDASKDGRPVLVDFWGMSCKNCVMMDKTTMKDKDVTAWFEKNKIVLLKVQGDDEKNTEAQVLMKYFNVIGFPTYVMMLPEK
ncbi:MAG: thioredoxin family protein [Lentisphaeria bacterium]|nr:thioredoxin family protein [Lentisphaeria bacterium]